MVAREIPEPPPVTRATLRSNLLIIFRCCEKRQNKQVPLTGPIAAYPSEFDSTCIVDRLFSNNKTTNVRISLYVNQHMHHSRVHILKASSSPRQFTITRRKKSPG
jgi:hypothetical protein